MLSYSPMPGYVGMRTMAKVNLFLEVSNKRADGYHDIDSIFLEISLHDTLFAKKNHTTAISVVCSDASLPTDEHNLVVKAVTLLRDHVGINAGIDMFLQKNIPPGSGLGGGSSNAVAALRLAQKLWKIPSGTGTLQTLAAKLGSDVPFFLQGGLCRCQGRGELITQLLPFPETVFLVLALPEIHSQTVVAYQGLDLPLPGSQRCPAALIEAIQAADMRTMESAAFNRFEASIFRDTPTLARLHRELEKLSGQPVRMSGSGSALWHFADSSYVKHMAQDRALSTWSADNRVRLIPVHAASTTFRSGDISS